MAQKIKLIISDLHLGRGRTLEGGATNFFEEFYFDSRFKEFLEYYSSGVYAKSEVELIINGDFFNFLQVDYRGHFLKCISESIAMEQLATIFQGHPEVFEALRGFLKSPLRSLTYVVGNHDQAMLWPGVRAQLDNFLGASIRYKNILYQFDGFHVEHGHMHEAANRFQPKRFFLKKDLPEPILNLPFGSHFFVDFILRLKQLNPHVDKVRPFKRMIRWAFINEPLFTVRSLFGMAIYFVKTLLTKDPRWRFSFRNIVQVIAESAVFPDLGQAARKILAQGRVHSVVFGHTRVYQYRQWGVNKEYFNTGTWTELTSLDIPSLGKITKLTYVFIEYGEGERARGRLKEWRGHHRVEEDVVIS